MTLGWPLVALLVVVVGAMMIGSALLGRKSGESRAKGAEEGEKQSLGVRRGVTEVYVGDDVAGRGEHAVSLHGLQGIHKPRRDRARREPKGSSGRP